MQLPNATTTSHRFTAWYAFSPTGDGIQMNTTGNTLQAIVKNLLQVLNGWEEKAEDFELDTSSLPPVGANDYALRICGEVYKEGTGTPENDNETLTVYVTVQVQAL